MPKLVAIMKATRRKFSAGFKAKVAIEALRGEGIICKAIQTFWSTSQHDQQMETGIYWTLCRSIWKEKRSLGRCRFGKTLYQDRRVGKGERLLKNVKKVGLWKDAGIWWTRRMPWIFANSVRFCLSIGAAYIMHRLGNRKKTWRSCAKIDEHYLNHPTEGVIRVQDFLFEKFIPEEWERILIKFEYRPFRIEISWWVV